MAGCTAVQILPEIQKVAKKVTVFQRTPNWVVPRADAPVSPLMRNVLKYVPPVRWRKRALQMDFREWTYGAIVDPNSDSAKMFRDAALDLMHTQLPDQPEMWEKLKIERLLSFEDLLVIIPGAADGCALLQDNKVAAVIAFDQVDGSAHARYASANDHHSGVGVVFVAHWHLRPWHVSFGRHTRDLMGGWGTERRGHTENKVKEGGRV